MKQGFKRSWPEYAWLLLFVMLWVAATIGLLNLPDKFSKNTHILNGLLSIGTSGIVAFIFYFVVSKRLESSRHEAARSANASAYRIAKRNIAQSIIHASQRGGRDDLIADTETIEKCLTINGFRELFDGGREADESFYAFQNQMSGDTFEFREIIFNLKLVERAAERVLLSAGIDDEQTYKRLVSLSNIVGQIEHNGAGYDSSKLLCSFIYEMFSGWNMAVGRIDYDPVERIFEQQD